MFFTDGAEDEISALFGYKIELGLGSFQEALAVKSAGANGDFGLRHIPAHAQRVNVGVDEDFDAVTLIGL